MSECKRCGSDQIVKSGMVRVKQRYLCKRCGYHFVAGDQREKGTTAVLKALCTIFREFDVWDSRMIGKYLKRDAALIYRWINENPRICQTSFNSRMYDYYNYRYLFGWLKKRGLADGDPILIADSIIDDDLYIAVIVQRRE